MAVDQSIHQINRRFEDMNIEPQKERHEFPLINHQMYHNYANETMLSNASVASSEMIGDGASLYSSPEDFPEVPVIVGPNGFIPPNGSIYTGPPGAIVNSHEYAQYPIDGMHYYNPMIDYYYGAQPTEGGVPVSTGMHYPSDINDGYVYGPQMYQYPMQPYYQQAPVGQYGNGGEMIMLDPHEQSVLIPNAYNNFVVPMSFSPCEYGAVSVTLSYPSHAIYPPQTLRASAPAWIETVPEAKNSVKNYMSEVSGSPQLLASNKCNKATNGSTLKNNSLASGKDNDVSPGTLAFSSDSKESNYSELIKKEDSNQSIETKSGVEYPAHRNGLQSKLTHPLTKASSFIPKDVGIYGKYNAEDFFVKYEDARFFIIKSYSEENVYRSIQYGVWASTPNGNKKLDDAYRDAQRRAVGKRHGCPVFLFFSVNGSRQFCGVAEMIGQVDYKKSMEFWEQHKWSGSFPVVWHCIKDVPNSMFRRVILQNNENKPVTNSRDTQEVILAQGLEMLHIVKSYPARTSIMDEFGNGTLAHQILAKPILDTKPPQQQSFQSFPKIGEQISGTQSEEGTTDLKPSNSSTARNVCEKGPKSKDLTTHLAKSLHPKVSPPIVVIDCLDKERQRVSDKENIKFIAKENVLPSV